MLALDAAAVRFLNQFANRSCTFDLAVKHLSKAPLLKGVFLFALIWWALFSSDREPERRDALLAVLPLSVLAIFVTRGLALALPFRLRPLHDPALAFQLTCRFPERTLDGWSSFPSDHAVLYAMLATGLAFASRRLGALAFAYVTTMVLLPRVYLGLHWPTDVLAGAALGIAFAQLARIPKLRDAVGRCAAEFRASQPAAFHAGLFLLSYLIATNFDELRSIAQHAAPLLSTGLGP